MNKKAITYIRQWIDKPSCNHVANKINSYDLMKYELIFFFLKKKSAMIKIFLLKLINMKLKERTPMINHLNAFQSMVN